MICGLDNFDGLLEKKSFGLGAPSQPAPSQDWRISKPGILFKYHLLQLSDIIALFVARCFPSTISRSPLASSYRLCNLRLRVPSSAQFSVSYPCLSPLFITLCRERAKLQTPSASVFFISSRRFCVFYTQ